MNEGDDDETELQPLTKKRRTSVSVSPPKSAKSRQTQKSVPVKKAGGNKAVKKAGKTDRTTTRRKKVEPVSADQLTEFVEVQVYSG